MQQHQDILDNISTSIVAFDEQLNVTAINSSGQALLEISRSRALGLHAGQLVLSTGEWLQQLQRALHSDRPITQRSVQLLLHGGKEVQVDLILNPITLAGDKIGLLVEIQAVDRLLRISREESRIQAQETSQAIILGLAHEIKNPLGGVRGAAQLLALELPDDSLTEYTQVIIREADRLRDLVDRMLGPHHQLNMQSINIHEILEHVRNLVAAESGNLVTISRDYDPSLPELQADRTQLIQAVLNIMRNALQASSDPAACEITLRTRLQRQFTIGATQHRLVYCIDIIDNGPGIPEKLKHAIFAPMVTGRAEGTGLGLSIAQSIISHHHGLLECSSEPGRTTFTIYLPMETRNAKAS